jgi:diguanylate cyclase (GGDEF)-like protein
MDREQAARDRAQAGIDVLTGVLLRGRGLVDLEHEIERARRGDGRLAVAFVDVDGLKEINDLYGHATGDRLLRNVGMALKAGLRSYDLVLRYGGDEFLCALPGADLENARLRFAEVARKLTGTNPQASVSVGLAALERLDTVDELTERADSAMYAGRDGARPPVHRTAGSP